MKYIVNHDLNYSKDNNTPEEYEKSKYCDRKQTISSPSQGVMDSIVQELTSVRLQQAIILSEIVGKPRSKTRKRRGSRT